MKTPNFLYGTAWKEDRTQELVELALEHGFRGIDTANQRKHYHEAAVGLGVAAAIQKGVVNRDELFIQTKFTFQRGQDHRLPYDANAAIGDQVHQSFARSLQHIQSDTINSYVLHGPSMRKGLGPDDWAAWKAMEEIHAAGRVQYLGISNVSLNQVRTLCDRATVAPTFVQNRCYANKGWDRDMRAFCSANGITYQGFSLLTANRQIFPLSKLTEIAARHQKTPSQIVFRFAMEVGMLPLTGTTSADHMKLDLAAENFSLTDEEVNVIERLLITN